LIQSVFVGLVAEVKSEESRAELLQASRAKPVYFSARDENISFVLIFFRTAAADRTIK